ncbi:hypothetical protein X798_03400 [Onchocerca flexuosa]|uniref:Uncharacterized protein n=1 Tax=Onchocerca flexuosa TaxID=387005 RepID=A0A238BWQ1_9BILA|nr:hypothetical protein X798_03400 [Onchocerca flexuosa]
MFCETPMDRFLKYYHLSVDKRQETAVEVLICRNFDLLLLVATGFAVQVSHYLSTLSNRDGRQKAEN